MPNRVICQELFQHVLLDPAKRDATLSHLHILSGYASAAMASRHILALREEQKGINIQLIYGMSGVDGVSKPNHVGFLSLGKKREFPYEGSFACRYIQKPYAIHSKLYVWCRGKVPVCAFIGSANYTENGFAPRQTRGEVLAPCDPDSALAVFREAVRLSKDCAEGSLPENLGTPRNLLPNNVRGEENREGISLETDSRSPFSGCLKATVSLITRSGSPGDGSNLNWGIRKNGTKRNRNQAYLALRGVVRTSDFFPPATQHFTVLTDDGKIFTCTRAQQGEKAIETPHDNSELGLYFRQRLGLPSGAYVSREALERYGRTTVTFYKLDEENYVMDFSSHPRR